MDEPEKRVCDECESLYRATTSKMMALCPECAHRLYGHEPCVHSFQDGRCVHCYWDGSISDYLASRQ